MTWVPSSRSIFGKWKLSRHYTCIAEISLNVTLKPQKISKVPRLARKVTYYMTSGVQCFLINNLKQQNRYLSIIIVYGYFSFIRSFTWLNFLSKSNSYHKTSLFMSFGCWHLSGIPLCPLHFTVYTIAWQRKFEPQWVFNINLCFLSG